ncbi:MAG: hypothetical protein H7Y17_16460 [Chlorobia bacterium]|nr:hypothetical protein [Fimbriimonadaceae bacterium]
MIYFLTLPEGAGHIDLFISRYDRSYGRRLVEMTYQQLLQRGVAPPGAYIFTDRDRMNPYQRRLAGAIRRRILNAGPGFRVLGDPERQLGRLELLQRLTKDGINDYRVHSLENLNPGSLRYPVFIRIEDDHMGPRTDLISSWEEVVQSIAGLVLAGFKKEQIIVIEFVETQGEDGLYRKYGSFCVGAQIVCQHILHSSSWLGKRESTIRTPELVIASDNFYHENPHADILMPLFEKAGIDYGRVDYSFAQGMIQVWEINDNPMFVGRNPRRVSKINKGEGFMRAFELLDADLPSADSLPLALDLVDIQQVVHG